MNEIYHSGVRGQKHGIRQYQNLDGTWTELGKLRRRLADGIANSSGDSGGSNKKKNLTIEGGMSKIYSSANNFANQITRDKPIDYRNYREEMSQLSDQDLQRRVNRMNLENSYMRLTDARVNYSRKRGEEVVKDIVYSVGAVTGIAGGIVTILKSVR